MENCKKHKTITLETGILPKKAINEFKNIYLEEIGVALSQEEATKKAIETLNLFKLLVKTC